MMTNEVTNPWFSRRSEIVVSDFNMASIKKKLRMKKAENKY